MIYLLSPVAGKERAHNLSWYGSGIFHEKVLIKWRIIDAERELLHIFAFN